MGKIFFKISLFLVLSIISFIIYFSYFGINTHRFDDLIKNRANEVNRHIKLEFEKTKIHFNVKELNLVVKLQKPKIYIKNSEINLSKLIFFLSIKSFLILIFY